MKKQLLIILILLSTSLFVNAQKEYRVAKSEGNLKLNLNDAIVEGYDGKEIIFSGKGVAVTEVDERAKGLVPLSNSGYVDNTGLGLSVTQNGTDITVRVVTKEPIGKLTIKVPQYMKVSFGDNNNGTYSSFLTIGNSSPINDELTLKNLKGEIEISVINNKIKLENNTGPMNIRTVRGSIEAIFSGEIIGPVSMISVYDYVDVTLPANTKANLELATSSGKLYAAKEFNIDVERNSGEAQELALGTTTTTNNVSGIRVKKQDGEKQPITIGTATTSNNPRGVIVNDVLISGTGTYNYNNNSSNNLTIGYFQNRGEKIKGKINGGGSDLIFKSTNKNVYLRQK